MIPIKDKYLNNHRAVAGIYQLVDTKKKKSVWSPYKTLSSLNDLLETRAPLQDISPERMILFPWLKI